MLGPKAEERVVSAGTRRFSFGRIWSLVDVKRSILKALIFAEDAATIFLSVEHSAFCDINAFLVKGAKISIEEDQARLFGYLFSEVCDSFNILVGT